jgi:Pyruvate/2-oxoacid:ferredoxin oxidoreductase delta subunit
MKRKLVRIDEPKCNGCGLCVEACHEGAIRIVDGKARLISDSYCDGLGACLGECPQKAITIEEQEAAPFDEQAVKAHLARSAARAKPHSPPAGACPGMRAFAVASRPTDARPDDTDAAPRSELRQWPVQLHLVPVNAPYWDGADLLVAADCVAVAYGGFHSNLLRDRRLIIACPKLDDTSDYVDKLAGILAGNDIQSLTVAHMEVPCCLGIVRIAEAAVAKSGKSIPFRSVTISVDGECADD